MGGIILAIPERKHSLFQGPPLRSGFPIERYSFDTLYCFLSLHDSFYKKEQIMVQSQFPEDEKLTRTVALQRAQSAQETMICSLKWSLVFVVFLDYNDYTVTTVTK